MKTRGSSASGSRHDRLIVTGDCAAIGRMIKKRMPQVIPIERIRKSMVVRPTRMFSRKHSHQMIQSVHGIFPDNSLGRTGAAEHNVVLCSEHFNDLHAL